MEARFQLSAANLAVLLAAVRQVGLGLVHASFCHPGARGQGWDLASQGSDSAHPGKCGAGLDCMEKNPGRKSTVEGGLEGRGMIGIGQ